MCDATAWTVAYFLGWNGIPMYHHRQRFVLEVIAVFVSLQKGKWRSHTFRFVFWHRVSENAYFQSESVGQFSVTHSGKSGPVPWSLSVCFRGFSPQSPVRVRGARLWGDRCVCRRALYLDHFHIACTIVEPYCHSSPLLHRPHTLACEYRLVGYPWLVEIAWMHRSHSRRGFRGALLYFNSKLLLLLATAIKTWCTPSGIFARLLCMRNRVVTFAREIQAMGT
jgi:hypothetical protein